MWQKSFSKIYQGLSKEQVWQTYADVNNWPSWDQGLEHCELRGAFVEGQKFLLKAKGGPKITIVLSKVIPQQQFTDYCDFFGARMYDDHQFAETPDGLRITNTISVTGWLSWLWVKLVVKNVAQGLEEQTDNLVKYIKAQA